MIHGTNNGYLKPWPAGMPDGYCVMQPDSNGIDPTTFYNSIVASWAHIPTEFKSPLMVGGSFNNGYSHGSLYPILYAGTALNLQTREENPSTAAWGSWIGVTTDLNVMQDPIVRQPYLRGFQVVNPGDHDATTGFTPTLWHEFSHYMDYNWHAIVNGDARALQKQSDDPYWQIQFNTLVSPIIGPNSSTPIYSGTNSNEFWAELFKLWICADTGAMGVPASQLWGNYCGYGYGGAISTPKYFYQWFKTNWPYAGQPNWDSTWGS